QAVTHCVGYLPVTVEDSHDGEDRVWRNRRFFRWRTYDAFDFDEFTEGKRQQLSAMTGEWFWGPGSLGFAAYDTLDAVLAIGTVTEGGSCYRCGGRRSRPACKCGPDEGAPATGSGPAGGAPGGGAGGRTGRR